MTHGSPSSTRLADGPAGSLEGPLTPAGMTWLGLSGICVASVVPSLDEPLRVGCETYFRKKPLFVGPKTTLGIKNLYRNPEEVGADRLVNAVAVHTIYRKATIVVDFGTATTLDCVSAKGEYLGGAICPGMELAGEWLATHTAKLPRVTFHPPPPEGLRRVSAEASAKADNPFPYPAIGKTTKESLQSGLFWGYISLVDGLLQRLTREMGGRPTVIVTGGLSSLIGPHLKGVSRIAPDLTLEGLRLVWERNR